MASKKEKTIAFLKLLYQESDEMHRLKTNNIIAKLKEQGYDCDRRSIYDDAKAFENAGVPIKKEIGYYIESRKLSLASAKYLLDCISASESFSISQSDEIKDELLSSLSSGQKEILENQYYCNPNIKSNDDFDTLNIIGSLVKAIDERIGIGFNYKKDKKNKYHNVSPYALTVEKARYYLIAYDQMLKKLTNFRVDKINNLKFKSYGYINLEEIDGYDECLDTADYLTSVYNMYAGKKEKVIIEFNAVIIEEIKKKFNNPEFTPVNKKNNIYKTTIEAKISDGFYSFILTMNDKIKIIEPKYVANEVKNRAKAVFDMYNDASV